MTTSQKPIATHAGGVAHHLGPGDIEAKLRFGDSGLHDVQLKNLRLEHIHAPCVDYPALGIRVPLKADELMARYGFIWIKQRPIFGEGDQLSKAEAEADGPKGIYFRRDEPETRTSPLIDKHVTECADCSFAIALHMLTEFCSLMHLLFGPDKHSAVYVSFNNFIEQPADAVGQ